MSVALIMARTTRLVAIGLRRTKSTLPINMQQKYCDHGRSTALLRITWPVPSGAQFLRPRRRGHERIDLVVCEKVLSTPVRATQLMSLAGSSPTLAAMILSKT